MTESLNNYRFSSENTIPPESIQSLRQSVDWVPDSKEVWEETLQAALGVVSAWKNEELVGIGFLVGARRHAVLCDLAVAPEHQGIGIGRSLMGRLMGVADEKGVRYTTLYYDYTKPWLLPFYQGFGFQAVNGAMQYVNLGSVPSK